MLSGFCHINSYNYHNNIYIMMTLTKSEFFQITFDRKLFFVLVYFIFLVHMFMLFDMIIPPPLFAASISAF